MLILAAFLKYDYGFIDRGESIEKAVFLPAMKKAGADVSTFWLEDNGYPHDIHLLQERLIARAEELNPVYIFFVLMNNEITSNTLKILNKKYKTVNWFCDDQWRFNSFTSRIAPLLTYSVTVDKFSIVDYKKFGCKNVILSQWATHFLTEENDIKKVSYKYDITFVGGKNLTREWIIYELKRSGIDVICFGTGWKNGRVSFSEMNEIFKASKINLNLSNSIPVDYRYRKYLLKKIIMTFVVFGFKDSLFSQLRSKLFMIKSFLFPGRSLKNVEQIKARNFEIPGCGGFELSQYSPGVEDYYIIGTEISVFSNIDDLKRMVIYYLFNEEERERIRIAGYRRTKNYTYEKRFLDIFREIEK